MIIATNFIKCSSLKPTAPANTWQGRLIIALLCLVAGQMAAAGAADAAALTVADVTAVEGAGLLFTVTLDNDVAVAFSVEASFTDGTASGVTDYDNRVHNLNFAGAAGERQTFTVATVDDAVLEGTETFTVSLAASNALILDSDRAVGTILNNDYSVSIGDAAAVEGNQIAFTVTLDRPVTGADVVIRYDTSNATATAGSDYSAAAGGSLTIAAPDASGIITIATIPDLNDESDETFTVTLSNTGLAGDNASITTTRTTWPTT